MAVLAPALGFLASFLVAVFTRIFWLIPFSISVKVAAAIAWGVSYVALVAALFAALKLLVLGLSKPIVANQYMAMAFSSLWPSNAELGIAAFWGASVLVSIFRHQKEVMRRFSLLT